MRALKLWALGAGLVFAACSSGDDDEQPAGVGGGSSGSSATPGGAAAATGGGQTGGAGTSPGGAAAMSTAGVNEVGVGGGGGVANGAGGVATGGVAMGGVATGGDALGGAAGLSGEAGAAGGVNQCPDWTLGGVPDVDDAGWQGASGVDFPDYVAQGAIAARSLLAEDNGTLFLQLRILTDVTPGNSASGNYRDSVYVVFADAALATIQVVRVAIDTGGGTHATRWMKSNGTWTSGPAAAGAPAWLSAFTAWVNPPVSGADAVSWAVDFKLATASAPGLKFWYAVAISPSGLAASKLFAWPSRGGFVEPNPPDTGVSASVWGEQFDVIGAANWASYSAALAKQCTP